MENSLQALADRVEAMKEQLEGFKKEIIGLGREEKTAALEIGWHKSDYGNLVYYNGNTSSLGTYGFSYGEKKWLTNMRFNVIDRTWTKATKEEVQTALQNYAEKSGYIKGATIKHLWNNLPELLETDGYYFDGKNLYSGPYGKTIIFEDGKWPEIIKPEIKAGEYYVVTTDKNSEEGKVGQANFTNDGTLYWDFTGLSCAYKPDQVTPASPEQIKEFKRKNEVVKIAGYEVKYVNEEYVTINEQQYSYHEFINMAYVLKFKGVKSINFLGSDVTLQDIDKLLEGFGK